MAAGIEPAAKIAHSPRRKQRASSVFRTQALQCIRSFGRCCYVGVGGPASIDFNRDVIFKVATIYGSWTFSKSELLEITRFMVDAKVPVDHVITHRYRLDQAVEAFRTFDSATTGKCVFVMD